MIFKPVTICLQESLRIPILLLRYRPVFQNIQLSGSLPGRFDLIHFRKSGGIFLLNLPACSLDFLLLCCQSFILPPHRRSGCCLRCPADFQPNLLPSVFQLGLLVFQLTDPDAGIFKCCLLTFRLAQLLLKLMNAEGVTIER